jgi:hypothetical protein
MDLNFHWKTFRSIFLQCYQNDRKTLEPLYVVAEKNIVIAVFSDTEDFSDWIGSSYYDLSTAFPQRNLIIYPREKIDHWLQTSLLQSHFYDQMLFLREQAKSYLTNHPQAFLGTSEKASFAHARIHESISSEHFLLKALHSWWLKVLPEYYGIYLELTENKSFLDLLIIIQGGKVVSFQVPDFSSISKTSPPSLGERMKFLKNHHRIPIQGISLSFQKWKEWSSLENPWNQIVRELKEKNQKMVPEYFGIELLIRTKAFFGRSRN